jgi:hypothetical protein
MNVELVLLIFQWYSLLASTDESHIENDLRKHLFKNYSSSIRPVNDKETPINVTFNMKLMQLSSVNEREQKITSQAYYVMRWRNEFLKWKPEDWGSINYLAVNYEEVWVPDIILKNNADGNVVTVQKDTDNIWI